MRKLEAEGSLYLLERSCKPIYKMLLLNRKPRDDFIDWIDEETEFVDKENFVAYSARLPNSEMRRRTFYFAIEAEKE